MLSTINNGKTCDMQVSASVRRGKVWWGEAWSPARIVAVVEESDHMLLDEDLQRSI